MSAVAQVVLEPGAALRLWSDVRRWPSFVEGLARVGEVSSSWPDRGAKVVWESVPGGRGRVTERVLERAPGRFATEVFEKRLLGMQAAEFVSADGGGTRVQLRLEYELTEGGPLRPLVDLLFVRRALRDALVRTLRRFAVEAEEEAGLR